LAFTGDVQLATTAPVASAYAVTCVCSTDGGIQPNAAYSTALSSVAMTTSHGYVQPAAPAQPAGGAIVCDTAYDWDASLHAQMKADAAPMVATYAPESLTTPANSDGMPLAELPRCLPVAPARMYVDGRLVYATQLPSADAWMPPTPAGPGASNVHLSAPDWPSNAYARPTFCPVAVSLTYSATTASDASSDMSTMR
jgi:hypothetical protein